LEGGEGSLAFATSVRMLRGVPKQRLRTPRVGRMCIHASQEDIFRDFIGNNKAFRDWCAILGSIVWLSISGALNLQIFELALMLE
jgi:hypothetical protein